MLKSLSLAGLAEPDNAGRTNMHQWRAGLFPGFAHPLHLSPPAERTLTALIPPIHQDHGLAAMPNRRRLQDKEASP